MATRVFEIAKELGVQSKVIVEKCRAEGIPESAVKNHMSTVSAGLEATIREWFGGGDGAVATAVETKAKVDLDRARAKPRRARAASASGDDADAAENRADEAETPEQTDAAAGAQPEARASGEPARQAAEAIAQDAGPSPAEAQAETPSAAANAPAPAAPRSVMPAGLSSTPPPREEPQIRGPRPAPGRPEGRPGDDRAPQRPGEPRGPQGPGAGPQGPGARPGAPGVRPGQPERRAPRMNVPDRPQIVRPAGPTLDTIKKEQIKLSGPKVVRVEAPEQVAVPRRRPAGPRFGAGGPAVGGGAGFGGPMGPGGPDRGGRGAGPGGRRRGDRGKGRGGESEGGWSQQDLAEREMRLSKAGGYLRSRRKSLMGGGGERSATPAQTGGKVTIAEPFNIKDLSAATGVKASEIIKKLFMQGVMATVNSGIDTEKAQEIMMDYDIELVVQEKKTAEQAVRESFADRERIDERPRGPVVTILGHVDHGKTSLLDRIRNANVAAGEAGGITQATSAFRVPVRAGEEEKHVVFIDTPGHEAFTAMRARGASVTDIVVLVVAADDGVMPQTKESIAHAKAAGVPIIVALNKIDKAEATDSNIQKILGQLAEQGLNPQDWGGETEVVRTSALKGTGIQELLEILDLQAQLLELKADFKGPARGTVIEARPEEGRGNVANILVQEGELKVGDFIVMGRGFGRVRDITDDRGNRIRSATPPMPVQISGIDALPDAGDKFFVTDSLKKAEQAAEQRRQKEREEQLAQPKVTLDSLFGQMADQDLKTINIVLKADVQGSVDVLKNEIEKVSGDEIRVRVLHNAVGGITESDVILAQASKAIIVGFNVIPSGKARRMAEDKGVEIRQYQVIYDIVEDIRKAAEGLLEPELRQEILGHAEVRQVFRVSKVGAVAGCYVTDGTVERDAFVRITRNDIIIEDNRRLSQLKRFKDDAREVRAGMECGMKIDGYDDIKEGDIIECYKQIKVKRTLA